MPAAAIGGDGRRLDAAGAAAVDAAAATMTTAAAAMANDVGRRRMVNR
jgi:hypothetical protein